MITPEDCYKIGHLTKPHGVKGEISFAFTDDVWDRVEADYLICMVDGILVPFFLEDYRFRSEHTALLKFQGMDTCDDVQELAGAEVFFPFALCPEEAPEEYTWSYFTGFRVEDEAAGDLGEIEEVDDTTQNVLFHVGGRLIPAVEAFITEIDHQGRVVRTSLPEGLLELND